MVFNVADFVAEPTIGKFEDCRKDDLIIVADHYRIVVNEALSKRKIKDELFGRLVDMGVLVVPATMVPVEADEASNGVVEQGSDVALRDGALDGSGLGEVVEPDERVAAVSKPPPGPAPSGLDSSSDSADSEASRRSMKAKAKVRIARLEKEERERIREREERERDRERSFRVELKKMEIEAETKIRLRQLELEMESKRLAVGVSLSPAAVAAQTASTTTSPLSSPSPTASATPSPNPGTYFDISKHIGLVPAFRESEVDAYFGAFERVATALRWPMDVWSILLQCKLNGKAQEAIATLSVDDSMQYSVVKATILRAYELVPEAYRQKFRQHWKGSDKTFVEFSREKEALFDRWCGASKATDFKTLRELILVEEVKRCLPDRIVVHLNEQRVNSVSTAGILADEFVLTHKSIFNSASASPNAQRKFGHVRNYAQSSQRPSDQAGARQKEERVCHYCKKAGHLIADCRKREQRNGHNGSKSVGLIKTERSVPDLSVCVRSAPDPSYDPFIFNGVVSVSQNDSEGQTIRILRDTGAQQSVILSGVLPLGEQTACGSSAIIRGVEMGFISAPLHTVHVRSALVSGYFKVAVRNELPIDGIALVMGNDIAGDKVYPVIEVVENPVFNDEPDELAVKFPDVFPVCVITRAQARKNGKDDLSNSIVMRALASGELPATPKVLAQRSSVNIKGGKVTDRVRDQLILPVTKESLIKAQRSDPTLEKCFAAVLSAEALKTKQMGYFCEGELLMRKWCPLGAEESDWSAVVQIVAPTAYRRQVLSLAHDHNWAGHLGVTKTYARILKYFFWPGLKQDVSQYCRTCLTCQMTGKPNQTIPAAPLCPIPAVGEPFERVIIDCVGPLPRTKSGNQYLLTIMCAATRFPEAVPLRKITATAVIKALTKFFATWGFAKVVQTDQGSNFLSKVFKQVMKTLSIEHVVSSAYHPESQGALERWHQTLKSMLRKYCLEVSRSWDEGIPFVLFAARDAVQESLGFSPNELIFGHTVRGPLKVLKDTFMAAGVSPEVNVLDFVNKFRGRLNKACSLAREYLGESQKDMKERYDKATVERSFNPGDQVLVLLPIPGSALSARFSGPHAILKKISDTNYVIGTPDRRRKSRVCHVNMLKRFHVREVGLVVAEPVASSSGPIDVQGASNDSQVPEDDGLVLRATPAQQARLCNSKMLTKLPEHLSHLLPEHQGDIIQLVTAYPEIFGDVPTRTNVLEHDIDVGRARPIKQHAYRVNPVKRALMVKEAEYLLAHGMARPSSSPWSSPCLLQAKSDGSPRFCTDYRKVNAVTVQDSYPLPRMEDCVDNLGSAAFVTKLDLLKGYWAVPLTRRASEVSAFVTPDHFLQYEVMAFGMCNAPATFQRLVNIVLEGVPNCNAYLDDLIVYSADWAEHIKLLKMVFGRLAKASLTLNLAKCEFGKATVTYLGRQVGQGQVRPIEAKVAAITAYPAPTTRRGLRQFLGMAGYYRSFCPNFSTVAHPLTSLLSPANAFIWSPRCQHAFESIKTLLCSAPVLAAPDFSRPFSLEVDASAVGAGAVLLQESVNGINHPVCYFSRKFNKYQVNYATIEKEALAMLLALQYFEVYVGSSPLPVVCYTDHNPLVFLQRMRNHNQRLMRWAILIEEYNLEIRHKRGADNVLADALSRAW